MADRKNKITDNINGPFYVDTDCIRCGNCADVALENFARGFAPDQEDEDFYYVHKQPQSDEEHDNCEQAMEECPVDAIGDDGE